jgi:hypothetical protein
MFGSRRKAAILAAAALSLMVLGTGSTFAQSITTAPTDPLATIDQDWGMGGWYGGDQLNAPDMWGGRGGRGDQMGPMRGGRGDRGLGFRDYERVRQLVRQELTVDLGDQGGIVTQRLEHGTVTAASDTSLTISLATGEAVTVALDGNTRIVKLPDFTTQTPGANATAADLAASAEVLVTSKSQADGSYLASAVRILPAAATSTDSTTPAATPSPASNG